jgi:predicted homoserine dehydrogenase-like protein
VPARRACADGLLPIGLASGAVLRRAVPADTMVSTADVEPAPQPLAARLRAEQRPAA